MTETSFRMKFDDTDMLTDLNDELTRLELKYNVGTLLRGDVEDREDFDIKGSMRSKQEHSVNNYLLQLELMAKDTPPLKKIVRSILRNEELPKGFDLTTPIRKSRRIIEIYREASKANPVKEASLLAKREAIKLQRRGGQNIKQSVQKLFDDFEDVEEEMNQHLKWVTIQKIDRIILQLASETELSSKISDIHSVSTWNFADFRTTILRFCQNIMDTARIQQLSTDSSNKADDTTTMSANATTITMDKTEYDALTSTPFNGRVRSSSPYQQKRERNNIPSQTIQDIREAHSRYGHQNARQMAETIARQAR